MSAPSIEVPEGLTVWHAFASEAHAVGRAIVDHPGVGDLVVDLSPCRADREALHARIMLRMPPRELGVAHLQRAEPPEPGTATELDALALARAWHAAAPNTWWAIRVDIDAHTYRARVPSLEGALAVIACTLVEHSGIAFEADA